MMTSQAGPMVAGAGERGARFAKMAHVFLSRAPMTLSRLPAALVAATFVLALPATARGAAPAPTPAVAEAAHLQVVRDLLAAIQAEKLLRVKAGMAHYPSEEQRKAVTAKVDQVVPATVYARLAPPVAKLISAASAAELARFYRTPYGQKLVHAMYNSGPSIAGGDPRPTAAEAAALKDPALVKARQEYAAAESAIGHEAFVLVTQIANGH